VSRAFPSPSGTTLWSDELAARGVRVTIGFLFDGSGCEGLVINLAFQNEHHAMVTEWNGMSLFATKDGVFVHSRQ
jgi:hypothetical protein